MGVRILLETQIRYQESPGSPLPHAYAPHIETIFMESRDVEAVSETRMCPGHHLVQTVDEVFGLVNSPVGVWGIAVGADLISKTLGDHRAADEDLDSVPKTSTS
jgi:hypothetical protein